MCSRVFWTSEGWPALIGRNWDWTDVVVTELYTAPRGVERSGMTPTSRTNATTSSSPTCPMWCGSIWTS